MEILPVACFRINKKAFQGKHTVRGPLLIRLWSGHYPIASWERDSLLVNRSTDMTKNITFSLYYMQSAIEMYL